MSCPGCHGPQLWVFQTPRETFQGSPIGARVVGVGDIGQLLTNQGRPWKAFVGPIRNAFVRSRERERERQREKERERDVEIAQVLTSELPDFCCPPCRPLVPLQGSASAEDVLV